MSIKMITIKGRTIVYDKSNSNTKYIGRAADGVAGALRYTEALRFGEKVKGTYVPGHAEKAHSVLSLMPELEQTSDGSYALAR